MLNALELIFIALVIIVSTPVAVFVLQVALAMLPYKRKIHGNSQRASCAILIPAHNESSGIIATLQSVQHEINANNPLAEKTRIVVVADNCNDDTASVARNHGAEVIERFSVSERGKGYALDFGIQHLAKQVPDIVLILDADCLLANGALATLINDAMTYKRPIQALYLMHALPTAPIKSKIAEFAWQVKNLVRPIGLHQAGLPCQLMGSGMAFPWAVLQQVNLASGHIVEDMKLGVDLAKLKRAPRFCPEALVTSQFPTSEQGLQTQRTRWEHGHLGMILKEAPLLILQGLRHANLSMLFLALDMAIPPLALLVLLLVVLSILSAVLFFVTQQILPLALALFDLGFVLVAVGLAWLKFARAILPFSSLLMVPVYIMVKIPLYLKFLVKRQSEWVRSKRD